VEQQYIEPKNKKMAFYIITGRGIIAEPAIISTINSWHQQVETYITSTVKRPGFKVDR